MNDITIQISRLSSEVYPEVWQLREEVLRRPLGMSLKNEDLSMDAEDYIFTAKDNDTVVGCVMLHPVDTSIMKLRQMAVYPQWQGKGIGALLVRHADSFAAASGYEKMVLHARKLAIEFYSKMGYSIVSHEFTEVGIPHVVMEKELSELVPID